MILMINGTIFYVISLDHIYMEPGTHIPCLLNFIYRHSPYLYECKVVGVIVNVYM